MRWQQDASLDGIFFAHMSMPTNAYAANPNLAYYFKPNNDSHRYGDAVFMEIQQETMKLLLPHHALSYWLEPVMAINQNRSSPVTCHSLMTLPV